MADKGKDSHGDFLFFPQECEFHRTEMIMLLRILSQCLEAKHLHIN